MYVVTVYLAETDLVKTIKNERKIEEKRPGHSRMYVVSGTSLKPISL
jgi:hypothetical protein